jgi:hypothetical protein
MAISADEIFEPERVRGRLRWRRPRSPKAIVSTQAAEDPPKMGGVAHLDSLNRHKKSATRALSIARGTTMRQAADRG